MVDSREFLRIWWVAIPFYSLSYIYYLKDPLHSTLGYYSK